MSKLKIESQRENAFLENVRERVKTDKEKKEEEFGQQLGWFKIN